MPVVCDYRALGYCLPGGKLPNAMIAYMRGLLQLPSDFDRAMREASVRRTVTDTDSYAFSIL